MNGLNNAACVPLSYDTCKIQLPWKTEESGHNTCHMSLLNQRIFSHWLATSNFLDGTQFTEKRRKNPVKGRVINSLDPVENGVERESQPLSAASRFVGY